MKALWASLAIASIAHAVDLQGHKLQIRHDECKPTTKTEYCTVTEKEIVTVKEYFTVTQTEACTTEYPVSSSECSEPSSTEPSSTLTSTSSPVISTTITPEPSSTSEPSSSSTSSSTSAVSTPTSCPVPPSCGNLGFDWAYYNNSARNTDTTYSTFHPDSFKSTQPIYVGTTDYVGGLYQGGASGETAAIYDSTVEFKLDYFALNHHSYLYACETGTYSITIPYANDAVYVWLGSKAYAGWTDNNADAKARYNQPDHIAGSASYEFTIPEGTYIPIRFFYGQAQYGGGFSFNVTTPSGQVIVSNEPTSSPYVVRYSCDGITAPRYPPFGGEI